MNRSTRALTAIMLISCSAMATAQEAPRALRRIGNLATVSECPAAPVFLEAMAAHGWIEGRTLSIECVSAIGRMQDLPKLATELVGRQPEVILAVSTPAVRAVKAATTTIPVVGITQDPVREGFVDNLSRPGGNITGIAQMGIGLASKRIEILKEILPGLKRLAVVARQGGDRFYLAELERELETATRTFGLVWGTANISRPEDIEGVLRQLRDEQYDAVYLVADPITFVNAHVIAESA